MASISFYGPVQDTGNVIDRRDSRVQCASSAVHLTPRAVHRPSQPRGILTRATTPPPLSLLAHTPPPFAASLEQLQIPFRHFVS